MSIEAKYVWRFESVPKSLEKPFYREANRLLSTDATKIRKMQ